MTVLEKLIESAEVIWGGTPGIAMLRMTRPTLDEFIADMEKGLDRNKDISAENKVEIREALKGPEFREYIERRFSRYLA